MWLRNDVTLLDYYAEPTLSSVREAGVSEGDKTNCRLSSSSTSTITSCHCPSFFYMYQNSMLGLRRIRPNLEFLRLESPDVSRPNFQNLGLESKPELGTYRATAKFKQEAKVIWQWLYRMTPAYTAHGSCRLHRAVRGHSMRSLQTD